MTAYHEFTLNDAIDFARRHYRGFAAGAALSAEEVGDGNLNRVFRVSDPQGQGVIVKQALPYIRCIGEGWPLTRQRAAREARVLLRHGELSPHGTLALLHHDDTLSALLLEDLSHWQLWRRALLETDEPESVATALGQHLARVLYGTSDFQVPSAIKRAEVVRLANPELCATTDTVFFHDPYRPGERNRVPPGLESDAAALWRDRELKHRVAHLRLRFQCNAEALLHGDLHTGSVFVREGECRVFDAEFGFYGPMGFDMGLVMANLLLNFCAQSGWRDAGAAEAARFARVEELRRLWKAFSEDFLARARTTSAPLLGEPGVAGEWVQQVWRDSLGFAGTEMIRRTIGIAHVADLDDIADPAQRQDCQRQALWLGRRLILEAATLSPVSLCGELRRLAAGEPVSGNGDQGMDSLPRGAWKRVRR
ncbi:S-methyl-5-thioribose kinase [Oceanimonas pelagia]|uniref:S-methyl-5-thioribose kinase n=1 Tax=Oceanimonas pelagia TaxID=3028314 RepID=A0AA50KRD0_9GAMM|nr:S-methyl-5-thioribose kinase [Oceanimonas pelagia]WMC12328.1 S-methyl-5-thioribose kinase [Oceanimonas pelagia]